MKLDDLDLGLGHGETLVGGEPRGTEEFTGTQALMLAVLEEGIRSYINGRGRIRTEAEQWIGTCRRNSLFSFVVVCETLGLDPDAARLALKQLRAKQAANNKPLARSRPNVSRRNRISLGGRA